jgi:hypothetical protein
MQLHFKEITLVGSSQGNYFENANACGKRMRKTLVATQLNRQVSNEREEDRKLCCEFRCFFVTTTKFYLAKTNSMEKPFL